MTADQVDRWDRPPPDPGTYADYLEVDELLSRQHPRTRVPDEYLFIITHQALELWFSQALHEIDQVVGWLSVDQLTPARRGVRRLQHIVKLWISHLDVLDTMPAREFAAFRGALGRASGLQSGQFRELEIASGLDPGPVLKIARALGAETGRLRDRVTTASLRQSFLDYLARADLTAAGLYAVPGPTGEAHDLAEDLIEYDLLFNQWRHRHYLLVVHAIGMRPGTAGSTGHTYLRNTLDNWFFPELWSARTMSDTAVPTTDPLIVPLDGSVQADRKLLGGKGWGLQQMHQLGIPVPPAFTLSTDAYRHFTEHGNALSDELWAEVVAALEPLERKTGTRFGGTPPLLVSVRSGAPVSMPGMMDTVLNVGELPRLREAISSVFESWHSDRARTYRKANGISDDLGTAVTVQAMVFGDRDERSGTGVYITRNPITGAPTPFGEWLARAQGDDLVSGVRTPEPLAAMADALPEVHKQLLAIGRRLERTQRHALEIEFTVESGELYLLQVRNASGSGLARAVWAVDLVHEGLIDIAEALSRVPADWTPPVDLPSVVRSDAPVARGLGVSAGIGVGIVVDDADEACDLADAGQPVILARPTTSPHDIHGFLAAVGVITEHGGTTSHAAVVGRQSGLPCVVGCGDGVVAALVGKLVTVDGTTGAVYLGAPDDADTTAGEPADVVQQIEDLLRWRAARSEGIRS
jgi:pyruvate,orthophosphate dikinase